METAFQKTKRKNFEKTVKIRNQREKEKPNKLKEKRTFYNCVTKNIPVIDY